MASVQLGPISPAYVDNVTAITLDGGSIKLSGQITAPMVNGFEDPLILAAVADQIRGLPYTVDAPEIPVVFSDKLTNLAHLNGFYTVTSSSVTVPQAGVDPEEPLGHWPWSVTLVPCRDRSAPRIESVLETVVRTNSVTITGTGVDPWHAIPAGANFYDDQAGQVLTPGATWTTSSGDIRWGRDVTTAPPVRRVATWRCPPANWYQGAAAVERQWAAPSGTLYLPIVGRDTSLIDGDTNWRISNGLVRLAPVAGDPTTFQLQCYRTTGGWQSPTTVQFQIYASPPYAPTRFVAATSFAIVRNTPNEVRVRLIGQMAAGVGPGSVIDLRLRRGQPWIDIRWAMPNSTVGLGQPGSLLISPTPSWSAIAGGGGQVATADVNGNKLVQFYPVGSTSATTGATSWDTALGWEINGGPTGTDNASLKAQYFGPSAELVRFLGA